KSVLAFKFRKGWEEGIFTSKSKFLSMARTTIIFPEIYSIGRQSRAESPFLRCKISQVIFAECNIRSFSTSNILGVPVEPEVCTVTVLDSEYHSAKNEITFSPNSF